ncbi:MAG TPA: hypothetical protein VH595_16890 [Verrucomicrobiae bacterium]|nr:hypothetical protein [Verrucomicrobiae bacterium]
MSQLHSLRMAALEWSLISVSRLISWPPHWLLKFAVAKSLFGGLGIANQKPGVVDFERETEGRE